MSVCRERNTAVQTIKSLARRRWEDQSEPHFSWYQPLEDGDAISRAVRWVLARPDVFLNTSSDARLLRATLEAATSAGASDASDAGATPAPSDAEMAADVDALGIEPLFDGDQLERI